MKVKLHDKGMYYYVLLCYKHNLKQKYICLRKLLREKYRKYCFCKQGDSYDPQNPIHFLFDKKSITGGEVVIATAIPSNQDIKNNK